MKIYFKNLQFVKHRLPHGDTTFDPTPASNCEKTNEQKIFSIMHLLTPSSKPDAGSWTWRQNSTEHIPVYFK